MTTVLEVVNGTFVHIVELGDGELLVTFSDIEQGKIPVAKSVEDVVFKSIKDGFAVNVVLRSFDNGYKEVVFMELKDK